MTKSREIAKDLLGTVCGPDGSSEGLIWSLGHFLVITGMAFTTVFVNLEMSAVYVQLY